MAKKPKKVVSAGKAWRPAMENPPSPTRAYPGEQPATRPQRRFLLNRGMTQAEVTQMTKRQASQEIAICKLADQRLTDQEAATRVDRDIQRSEDQSASSTRNHDDSEPTSPYVSDRAIEILGMIAQGFTYDQILGRIEGLTPRDIFDAAQEVVEVLQDSADTDVEPVEKPDDGIPF